MARRTSVFVQLFVARELSGLTFDVRSVYGSETLERRLCESLEESRKSAGD